MRNELLKLVDKSVLNVEEISCYLNGLDSKSIIEQINHDSLYGFPVLHRLSSVKYKDESWTYLRVIELLLEFGGDITLRDITGNSPFHWACFIGNSKVVRLFLSRNESLMHQLSLNDLKTGMELALEREHKEVLQIIFEYSENVFDLRPVLYRSRVSRIFKVSLQKFSFLVKKKQSFKDAFVAASPMLDSLFVWDEYRPSPYRVNLFSIFRYEDIVAIRASSKSKSRGRTLVLHLYSLDKNQRLSIFCESNQATQILKDCVLVGCLDKKVLPVVRIQSLMRGFFARKLYHKLQIYHLDNKPIQKVSLGRSSSAPSAITSKAIQKMRRMITFGGSTLTRGEIEQENNKDNCYGYLRIRQVVQGVLYWSSPKYFEISKQWNGLYHSQLLKLESKESSVCIVDFSKLFRVTLQNEKRIKLETLNKECIFFEANDQMDALKWVNALKMAIDVKIASAVVVQTHCRMKLAKNRKQRIKLYHKIELARVAGVEKQIQLQQEEMENKFIPFEAALTLQRVYRGAKTRKMLLLKGKKNNDIDGYDSDDIWTTARDKTTQKLYYINQTKKKSTWTPPEWIKSFDQSENRYFWFNTKSRKSTWTPIIGSTSDTLKLKMIIQQVVYLLNLPDLDQYYNNYGVFAKHLFQDDGILLCQLFQVVFPKIEIQHTDGIQTVIAKVNSLLNLSVNFDEHLESNIFILIQPLLHYYNVERAKKNDIVYNWIKETENKSNPFADTQSLPKFIWEQVLQNEPTNTDLINKISKEMKRKGHILYPTSEECLLSTSRFIQIGICAFSI